MMNESLKKLLDKEYPASSVEEMSYRGRDVAIKTDEKGRAVLVFIGKKIAPGKIRGERYVRSIETLSNGETKDNWERKVSSQKS